MKVIRFQSINYKPASHEDPNDPGVYKKILVKRNAIQDGHLQMINWAKIPVGKSFAKHYHQDLQEVFIIISGMGHIVVDDQQAELKPGDVVVIDPHEKHSMKNTGEDLLEYIVIGVAVGQEGKTVVQ